MTIMKRALLGIVATSTVLVALTGCSGTSNQPQGLTWVNTDRGAVQCLKYDAAYGDQTTSCKWSTLRLGESVNDAEHYDGAWTNTKAGTVYCIAVDLSHGYQQHDCDWDHIKTSN